MAADRSAVPVDPPAPEQCWCCDSRDAPERMIHLGNRPEVALCRPCARWAAQQAGEIDDRSRTGLPVAIRSAVRRVRRVVIEHGWHQSRVAGRALRWLGRYLP